jgi:hypothetical protein
MSVQNEDSTWKYSLKGPKGSFIAAMYFMGDGFFHIVSYIVFAYTYQEYVFLLFSLMLIAMFILLSIGFGVNVVGSEVLTRAMILSPLMSTLDFPMKSHLEKEGNWIITRSVTISFVALWTCNLLALFTPINKLPDSEGKGLSSLSNQITIMLAAATAVKFLAYYYIESQEHAKGKNVELELSAFNSQDLPTTLQLNVQANPLARNGGDKAKTTTVKAAKKASVFVERFSSSPKTKQWMRGDVSKSPLMSNKVTLTANPLHQNPTQADMDEHTVTIGIE